MKTVSPRHVPPRYLNALALCGLMLSTGAVTAQEAAEEALARKPLESYMQGHATGDPAHIRAAFLPTARVDGLRDGKLVSRTAEEFASGFSGKPANDEAQRKRRIDRIELHGDAGMAQVTLDYPTITFTDYFVLLKVDGEWKIASKVYDAVRK
jgi:hypothetical protein